MHLLSEEKLANAKAALAGQDVSGGLRLALSRLQIPTWSWHQLNRNVMGGPMLCLAVPSLGLGVVLRLGWEGTLSGKAVCCHLPVFSELLA